MKYFLAFLLFLIIGVLVFAYFQITNIEVKPEIASHRKIKTPSFEKLKKMEFNSFNLPAREMFSKIDFRNYKNVILYKLSLKVDDKFTLFNIETLLNRYNIVYSLYEGKKIEIFMIFKNLEEANRVISLFKEYNFKIKLQKIKKRI